MNARISSNQTGGLIVGVCIVLVVALGGLIGWIVWHASNNTMNKHSDEVIKRAYAAQQTKLSGYSSASETFIKAMLSNDPGKAFSLTSPAYRADTTGTIAALSASFQQLEPYIANQGFKRIKEDSSTFKGKPIVSAEYQFDRGVYVLLVLENNAGQWQVASWHASSTPLDPLAALFNFSE